MLITIPKENIAGENRVALTPEGVRKLKNTYKGVKFFVQKGAGEAAGFTDADYKASGAELSTEKQCFNGDIVLKVTPPSEKEAKQLKKGALLVGNLDPFASEKLFKSLAKEGVNALSMERIPRISRAQSMDTLSSQAGIAGYRAVLEAANQYNKFFPLMMTSAGSSKPSKVVVLGAGVAGLQAIATAKRLGAQVSAFDVRPEVAEQVQSLGGKFIELDIGEEGSGEGGYAKELSAEGKKKQQAALTEVLKKADIIISTAQIPGRPAPVLITEEAVKGMASGSVVVDMAAGGYNKSNKVKGGNCPLTKADEIVEVNGVKIIGYTNYPSMVASDASSFYSRNVMNLLNLLLKEKEGKVSINYNMEDEIIAKSLSVFEGEVR